MQQETLHELLQQASNRIQEAQEAFREAQGSNETFFEQAVRLLTEGEQVLKNAQQQAGTEATENPQFQQAYEQLHDTRQQLQDIKHNNHGV